MNTISLERRAAVTVLTLLVALAALHAGCRRGAQKGADANAGQSVSAPPDGAPTPADITQLNADIERLEKQAERNPADEETQDELARVYVRRAKLERDGGQF